MCTQDCACDPWWQRGCKRPGWERKRKSAYETREIISTFISMSRILCRVFSSSSVFSSTVFRSTFINKMANSLKKVWNVQSKYNKCIWGLSKTVLTRFTTKSARLARSNNYTDRQPGSVTQMVTQLGWEPLQVRRVKIRLLLIFKIQHNLVAIPAEAYL